MNNKFYFGVVFAACLPARVALFPLLRADDLLTHHNNELINKGHLAHLFGTHYIGIVRVCQPKNYDNL